jgi:hypothetical protein
MLRNSPPGVIEALVNHFGAERARQIIDASGTEPEKGCTCRRSKLWVGDALKVPILIKSPGCPVHSAAPAPAPAEQPRPVRITVRAEGEAVVLRFSEAVNWICLPVSDARNVMGQIAMEAHYAAAAEPDSLMDRAARLAAGFSTADGTCIVPARELAAAVAGLLIEIRVATVAQMMRDALPVPSENGDTGGT